MGREHSLRPLSTRARYKIRWFRFFYLLLFFFFTRISLEANNARVREAFFLHKDKKVCLVRAEVVACESRYILILFAISKRKRRGFALASHCHAPCQSLVARVLYAKKKRRKQVKRRVFFFPQVILYASRISEKTTFRPSCVDLTLACSILNKYTTQQTVYIFSYTHAKPSQARKATLSLRMDIV